MNLRQLEAFRAVMLSQTVTRAAEVLHISQPATTRLILSLEENLGFALFERTKGRLQPTSEALVLYEEVQRSLIGVERIARTAREISNLTRGSLQIACAPALGLSFMPRIITAFLKEHEHAQVTLVVQSSREVIDAIMGERCDVGFIAQPNAYPSPWGEKIIKSHLVCALPRGHLLCSKAVITPADLEGENFISYPQSVASRQHVDAIFTAYGVERKMNIEAQLSTAICKFVEQGAGVALVDSVSAMEYLGAGIVFCRFEPSIEMDFCMLISPRRKASPFHESFFRHVREFTARELKLQPT